MSIRNAQNLTFKAKGLSDAVDGTQTFPGAMGILQDLIPNVSTDNQFVPRPASTQVTDFTGFSTPAGVTALLVVGTRAYGMIASARNAGKDEPFCYDLVGAAFVAITNVTSANSPTTQSTSGDWTPPQMAMIANKIMITHPGYSGANQVGWIDVSSAAPSTTTGTTHTSTTLDTLATSVLTLGWQVGYHITGPDIPANTYIVSIAADGLSLVLSAAATGGHAGGTYTVVGGTSAAPIYGAGKVNGQAMPVAPVAVAEFNGRAYYAVNNGVQFSDSLLPLQITNASQQLTMGDNTAVTALGGLPLSSQVVGGSIQSLIAFKGSEVLYQVTGDPVTSNLANNAIEGSTGTRAPNTITPTPFGLAFIAPDGLRLLGLDGKLSIPIGVYGQGVNEPFTQAIYPSRMCACFHQNVLRVSVQNGAAQGQPVQEYWYDFNKSIWCGPHTFPAALIASYEAGGSNSFILAASGIDAKLWQSKTFVDSVATYVENGVNMSWIWQTTLMPDNEQGAANKVVESTQGFAFPSGQMITILAMDEEGSSLGVVILSSSGAGNAIWGSFVWGTGVWGGATTPYQQYQLPWPAPLVFKQMSLRTTGASVGGLVIGNLYAKYQVLGYLGAANAA